MPCYRYISLNDNKLVIINHISASWQCNTQQIYQPTSCASTFGFRWWF